MILHVCQERIKIKESKHCKCCPSPALTSYVFCKGTSHEPMSSSMQVQFSGWTLPRGGNPLGLVGITNQGPDINQGLTLVSSTCQRDLSYLRVDPANTISKSKSISESWSIFPMQGSIGPVYVFADPYRKNSMITSTS